MLLRRREDVENAAPYGDLPSLLDQVYPVVGSLHECADDVVQLGGVAGTELYGYEVAEARHLRLQHRADRGDDDLERPGRRVGVGPDVGVAEPSQHGQPPADGVGTGRQT